jgi:hypothetical protein
MTFREAARRLRSMASEAREVARRLEAEQGTDGWALAHDVNALGATIDRYAVFADQFGERAGETSAEEAAWVASAAPGELMELYGK